MSIQDLQDLKRRLEREVADYHSAVNRIVERGPENLDEHAAMSLASQCNELAKVANQLETVKRSLRYLSMTKVNDAKRS